MTNLIEDVLETCMDKHELGAAEALVFAFVILRGGTARFDQLEIDLLAWCLKNGDPTREKVLTWAREGIGCCLFVIDLNDRIICGRKAAKGRNYCWEHEWESQN